MNIYEKFRKMINLESGDDKFDYLLEGAKNFILSYTNRTEKQWLSFFDSIQLRIAVIDFNKIGVEGIYSRAEGGISTNYGGVDDYPNSIISPLKSKRIIKGFD